MHKAEVEARAEDPPRQLRRTHLALQGDEADHGRSLACAREAEHCPLQSE